MGFLQRHLTSYKYAFRGIGMAFKLEVNMWIHLLATILVIAANILFQVTPTEWLITLTLVGIVWAAELFNTAIEKLADRVTREHDPIIGQVKDLASGAVLVVCVVALVGGWVVYWQYFKT